MNYVFYEYHREEDIPASLSRMLFGLARLRLALLRKLGWRGWLRFNQQQAFLKDALRGAFLLPFRGTQLRKSKLVRMMFRSREMVSPPAFSAPGCAEMQKKYRWQKDTENIITK
jgi:hypothetical protein